MPNISFPRDFPFSIDDMRSEFDRLLDRVWHGGLKTAPLDGQDWAPCIDVNDEGSGYHIRVEIPGLCAEDVEVSILDGVLSIRGNKPHPGKPDTPDTPGEKAGRLRTECRYGGFCRKYEFPLPVEEGGVKAACKYGVLDITVPKVHEAKGRSVVVKSED